MADVMTPEQRSRCMAAIKGKDTKPEMIVRKYLFSRGMRYRVNNRKLPGSPDIVLKKYKTVVFIDGYYDIERISFGTRTKGAKDGSTIPGFPTLRIKLGAFHPFDRSYSEGIVPRMANQIWSYSQLQNVMAKSNSYGTSDPNFLTAEEPYGNFSNPIESDYIENKLN